MGAIEQHLVGAQQTRAQQAAPLLAAFNKCRGAACSAPTYCAPAYCAPTGLYRLAVILLALILAGCRAALVPLSGENQDDTSATSEVVLLRIATCSSGLPLVQDLTTALAASNSSLSVDITAGDSPSPVELVASGQADIALIALPADALTLPTLPAAYAAYQPTLLAIDALGVMVRKNAALRALSKEELVKLFSGYVLDWEELGAGSGQPELVGVQAETATRELFMSRLLGKESLSSATVLLPNDRAVVEYLAEHPLAVGFASVANRDERVQLISLDGVIPTPKGVARGTYPYTWALYALVSPQAPAPAGEWLAFARSATGQDLIAQRYTLPQ